MRGQVEHQTTLEMGLFASLEMLHVKQGCGMVAAAWWLRHGGWAGVCDRDPAPSTLFPSLGL